MSMSSQRRNGPLIELLETLDRAPDGTRPVLLLHRAGGSSRDWKAQVEAVGRVRRVIAPDLPGHGRSPGPALTEVVEMAKAVAELIERLELRGVVVVGHSMGGAVALELALSWPHLVAGLVLVASGARLHVARQLSEAFRSRPDLVQDLAARTLFSPRTPRALVEAEIPVLFDAPLDVVLSDLEACHRFDVEPRLGDLSVPVTVIAGTDDVLTSVRLGRRVVERVPTGRLRVVTGAGHMIPREAPGVVNEEILSASGAVPVCDARVDAGGSGGPEGQR
jgi:pimeloyl-ACP methyl ester carboxylesterase